MMKWPVRWEQRGGDFGVVYWEAGQERWLNTKEMKGYLDKGPVKIPISTNLSTWKLASTEQVAELLNLPAEICNQHQCYLFEHEKTTYLVPCLALIKGLFKPISFFGEWLMHPVGLDNLIIPTPSCSEPVAFNVNAVELRWHRLQNLTQYYSWMLSSPSARRMWHSVYPRALTGLIGLELPDAVINLRCTGEVLRDVVLVKSLNPTKLQAIEAGIHRKAELPIEIQIHHMVRITTEKKPLEKKLVNALRNRPSPALTDAEWGALEPMLTGFPTKVPTRLVLQGVLNRFAEEKSWKKAKYLVGDCSMACSYYARWKKNGKWEQICRLLIEGKPIELGSNKRKTLNQEQILL